VTAPALLRVGARKAASGNRHSPALHSRQKLSLAVKTPNFVKV
jgi:hypothetical protein